MTESAEKLIHLFTLLRQRQTLLSDTRWDMQTNNRRDLAGLFNRGDA